MKHPACYALTCTLGLAPVLAGDAPTPEDLLGKELDRVGEEMKNGFGDWSRESALIRAATHKLWERNGWKDEADQFALQLIEEMNQIPPWEVAQRWDAFAGRLTERYQLTPEQKQRMETLLYQESLGLFLKHARTIIEQTRGVIATRGRGQPFTPEQIARWAAEGEPLLKDAIASAQRMAEQMAGEMSPAQRETLERDMSSLNRRIQYIEKMRPEWAKGRWQPQDWGMEDDPIQNGAGALAQDPSQRGPAAAGSPAAGNTRLLPYDESTWHVYVKTFTDDYRLDAAQKASADSILDELVARAAQYRRDHLDELSAVPVAQRIYAPAYAPIRVSFEELKTRLDALPTRTQRWFRSSVNR